MNDQQQPIEHDGTIDGAVLNMPDIESLERASGHHQPAPVARDETGKFQATKPKEEAPPVVEAKAEAEAPAEDDPEDLIEIPGEGEGAEPVRHKLSEVLEGWSKAKQLEAELAEVRKAPAMPPQFEKELVETVQARQKLISVLTELEQTALPPQPSLDLINVNSQLYNPDQFYRMVTDYQQAVAQRQHVQAAREQATKEQAEQSKVLAEARYQREWAKATEIWPELKDQNARAKAADDVSKTYGFSAQEIQAIDDARVLAVLKDALAYRSGKAAQETAVKVVKAKPKLVRAAARETQNSKQAQYSTAAQRLSQSHSLEDAAEAIGALLR